MPLISPPDGTKQCAKELGKQERELEQKHAQQAQKHAQQLEQKHAQLQQCQHGAQAQPPADPQAPLRQAAGAQKSPDDASQRRQSAGSPLRNPRAHRDREMQGVAEGPRLPSLGAGAPGKGTRGEHSAASTASLPAPPAVPWRNAAAVAVDNTDPAAQDGPNCGIPGEPPCLSVRQGVLRAVSGGTVTVQGGGEPYLGECGAPATPTRARRLQAMGRTGFATPRPAQSALADTHYGDPCSAGGCLADEQETALGGVDGSYCAPICTVADCPADVPAGVTATPSCAVDAAAGGKLCALICSPTAGIRDQEAADAQCGDSASCKPISGTGICTYDDCGPSPAPTPPLVPTPAPTPWFPGSSGIRIDGISLTVQGVGGVVIDCENHGRAFRFNASNTTAEATPGAGATLRLVGLEVRNGAAPTAVGEDGMGGAVWAGGGGALELDACAFVDCAAAVRAGGVYAQDVQVSVSGSRFERTATPGWGGGMVMRFDVPVGAIAAVRVSSTNFTDTSSGSLGGGLFLGYVTAVQGGATTIEGCGFFGTRATSNGGGAFLQFGSATNATVAVRDSHFIDTSGSVGGGLSLIYYGDVQGGSTAIEGCGFVGTRATSGSGGGAYLAFVGSATNATVALRDSHFNGTSGSLGGGLFLFYPDAVQGGSTAIEDCGFVGTRATSSGGGAYLGFSGSATDATVAVRNSHFNDTTSGSDGGGLYLGYVDAVQGGSTAIEGCSFVGTRATSGGGGGLFLYYGDTVQGGSTAIEGCGFVGTRATSSGGGLRLYYGLPTRGTTVALRRSSFVDAACGNTGAGAQIVFLNGATDVTTLVDGCAFARTDGNSALTISYGSYGRGASADIRTAIADTVFRVTSGGGALVMFQAPSARTTTNLTNVTFAGNVNNSAARLYYDGPTTAGAALRIEGARFDGNDAPTASFGGGALRVKVTGAADGMSLAVLRSTFAGNAVRGAGGGGALLLELPQDTPRNLRFIGNPDASVWRNMSAGSDTSGDDDGRNPFYPYPLPPDLEGDPCSGCGSYPNGCVSCPQFKPYLIVDKLPIFPLENVYREWTAANTFLVRGCNFSHNTATYKGGAIAVPGGGSGAIEDTIIEGNDAELLFGGGVAVGGTAKLALRNTTLCGNTCGQSGCQLYSASGAGIALDSSSLVDLTACEGGACSEGLSAAQAGNVTWSNGSTMVCDAGYQLLNSSGLGYATTLNNWRLEAPSVYPPTCTLSANGVATAVDALGNTPFTNSTCQVLDNITNCPCYFSDNPYGAAFSAGFGTGTLFPAILVSTLSYGCRACPTGRFNPTSPALGAANLNDTRTTIGACDPCPAGKFQGLVGQALCDLCPAGQSQSDAGLKSCVPCADGFFQLEAGATNCTACPVGAGCTAGGLLPKAQQYGIPLPDGRYAFALCPTGYCVATNDGDGDFAANATYAQCANASHRDWTVPLCGACMSGFSQSISTANCIANDTCASTAQWLWPASLLYCLVYAAYFLWSSTPVDKSSSDAGGSEHEDAGEASGYSEWCADEQLEHNPRLVGNTRGLRLTFTTPEDEEHAAPAQESGSACTRSTIARVRGSRAAIALEAGSIKVIAFFFQMAGLVVPIKGVTARMGETLRSFFGMQVSSETSGTASAGAGYCVWAGMSSPDKIKMFYAVPVAMGVVLWLVAKAGDAATRTRAQCRGTDASPTQLQAQGLGARLPGAFAGLLLLAYSTLTKTTLQLLQCVKLPDGNRVLFLAGATECGIWQAPLYALIAVLVLLPAAPLLVLGARQLPPTKRLTKVALAMRFPAHPTAQALRSSLTKAFTPDNWHWPALLALQRFVMVATPIFVSDNIQSSLVLTCIAFVMAWKQARASPYQNADVNAHAKLAAICLVALAVLVAPQRVLAQASVDLNSPSRQTLKNVCDGIEILMIFFLLAPVLAPVLAPMVHTTKDRMLSSFFRDHSEMSMHTVHAESGELSAPLVPEHVRGVV
jgi:hypothetical protein